MTTKAMLAPGDVERHLIRPADHPADEVWVQIKHERETAYPERPYVVTLLHGDDRVMAEARHRTEREARDHGNSLWADWRSR